MAYVKYGIKTPNQRLPPPTQSGTSKEEENRREFLLHILQTGPFLWSSPRTAKSSCLSLVGLRGDLMENKMCYRHQFSTHILLVEKLKECGQNVLCE